MEEERTKKHKKLVQIPARKQSDYRGSIKAGCDKLMDDHNLHAPLALLIIIKSTCAFQLPSKADNTEEHPKNTQVNMTNGSGDLGIV